MLVKIGLLLLLVLLGALIVLAGVYLQGDARGRLPGIEEGLGEQVVRPPASVAPPASAVPRPAPLKGRYTLQLGVFRARAQADALTAEVEALALPGIKARTLTVRDVAGETAWVTLAGDQDLPLALESARIWLSERFKLSDARAIPMPTGAR